MEGQRVKLDGGVIGKGLRLAVSRSEEPILCLLKRGTIRLIAVSGLRLVVSWETRLSQPVTGDLAFLIPPLIAELLSTDAVCAQIVVEFIVGHEQVVARFTDHFGSYELYWRSDLASFPAPEAFGQMMKVPYVLMDVPYVRFSDATHAAVAKLVRIEADQEINPAKLAILIDLDFGRLRLNGQEIVTSESRQYYFDPRLVIRALEFLKERILAVGVSPLPGGERGYLSLIAQQEDWKVHCSLLSIGKDTQRLYPLPTGRSR